MACSVAMRFPSVSVSRCEPYITSDDRLMRETPERVVGGLRVVLQILQPKRAAIGNEQYKPEAWTNSARPFSSSAMPR